MKKRMFTLTLLSLPLTILSCSNSYDVLSAPSIPSASYSKASSLGGSLSEASVSSAQRTVVKSGRMDVRVANVKEASDQLEDVVAEQQGYMTSMSRVETESHSANYEIRVPATNLSSTMDAIATLGDLDRRRVWVSDESQSVVRFQARLADLKNRRERFKRMLSSASKTEDKIKVEEILSGLEREIFEMELGLKQVMKHSKYSKLSVELDRKRIRGPIGLALDSWSWTHRKLFTIRH